MFDEPYLATSLQDFWGRRWNLMVSSIFRSAIYAPTRDVFKRKPGLANFMGFSLRSSAVVFFTSFVTSIQLVWRLLIRSLCCLCYMGFVLRPKWRSRKQRLGGGGRWDQRCLGCSRCRFWLWPVVGSFSHKCTEGEIYTPVKACCSLISSTTSNLWFRWFILNYQMNYSWNKA